MLKIVNGDLFEANVEAVVNPVNTVGIMGAGLALQFKNKFPNNFKSYQAACNSGDVQTGKMFVYNLGVTAHPKLIINFPTKQHWKDPSEMSYIEDGLTDLLKVINYYNIKSIAIPALGSGLGGLKWSEVLAKIEYAFKDLLQIEVLVFPPQI